MKPKIVMIGAGSAIFSLSLIKDICLTPNLEGSRICLVDINEARLNTAYLLCTRYAKELGVALEITKTLDREEGLVGADFVINTALACGYGRLQEGLAIAEEMGYHYGGSLHVMHDEAFWSNFYQFRMLEEVYLDTRRIAPNAWYILASNPVLTVTTMLGRKYHDPKIVGVCEGPSVIHDMFAKLGFDEKDVSYEVVGSNHFVWLTKMHHKGEDAFPILDQWIEEHQEDPALAEFSLCPKALDMYKTFGVMPLGDTYTAGGGSYGWWYHSSPEVEKTFREDPAGNWSNHYSACVERVAELERNVLDQDIQLTQLYPPVHSGEWIIDLIEALSCDVEKKLILNILNDGSYVPGIPTDFNVEILTMCNKNGVKGIRTDGLPRAVLGHLFADRIGMVEVELAAYQERDEELLVDLVMMDRQTKSREQARILVDRILALPWNEPMREHYRGLGSKRRKHSIKK